MSEITTITSKSNTNIQVQIKPIRMEYTTNNNIRNTTALAVYAPIEYLAEVKGACIRITHDKASHSLGLNRGKFHEAQAISRTRGPCDMILASHDNKISNSSMILLRVEAPEWSRQVTTGECREISATSYNDRNHITTVFDLFQASIQEKFGATDTHISYYINQTDATIINITTTTNKQSAVFEAISSLENSHYRRTFARSSLVTALPHHSQFYLYTADSKNERIKKIKAESSRQTSTHQQAKPQTKPNYTAAKPTPTKPTAKPESQTNIKH